MKKVIKVLIVDDSVVFRKILKEALSKHPGITVVGSAVNGKDALKKIRGLRPHLVVMDVEMPELDGLQTLDQIKKQHLKVGVIMFSTLTSKGAKTTLDALSKGAFDFVPKPTGAGAFAESVKRIESELIPKIEAYGQHQGPTATRTVKNYRRPAPGPQKISTLHSRPDPRQPAARHRPASTTACRKPLGVSTAAVAIGVSTGGPNALIEVIPKFPAGFNLPIFLVQHMPPVFTTQLARRLNEKSKLSVVEAEDRQHVQAGVVYLAPGDFHMQVARDGNSKIIRLNQNPPENSCRPAVDVLFRSVAEVYGSSAIGVIMTGMGQDGLAGTRLLKGKGAVIIAQDKDTSVVWGMPKFVTEEGLADRICALQDIEPAILEMSGFARRTPRPAPRKTWSASAR